MDSPVGSFYDDAHILITGGTGFMGKVLIEKLLRSCPGISQIYLLIRTKKDTSPEDRVQQLFKDELFDTLKSKSGNFMSKISLIEGDCSAPGLGISNSDRDRLQSQVTHVFHNAATVNFNAKLDTAIRINVLSVKEMIQFCKQCTHLKVFLHTSTAFSNCHLLRVDENYRPPPISSDAAINLLECLDSHHLAKITPKLIEPWPNTYCFTKSIAESLIRDTAGDLPVGIFRPAIVASTADEPIRGWIDNMNGTIGVCYLLSLGLIHVQQLVGENVYYCIPVDKTINAQICAAWKVGIRHQKRLLQNDGSCLDLCRHDVGTLTNENQAEIFNFFGHPENVWNWKQVGKSITSNAKQIPPLQTKWKIFYFTCSSRFCYLALRFLFHTVPAHISDFGSYMMGKKTRLRKMYGKIHFMLDSVLFFTNTEILITGNNFEELWKTLSPADQIKFPFDMKNLCWSQYGKETWLGIRQYLLKEQLTTLPAARRKHLMLEIAHFTLLCFILLVPMLIFYIFY